MKRSFSILAHCLFVLCHCFSHQGAALSNWENMGLYGGQINTLAISSKDSNLIFAGSWSGDGLFKSTDGGIHWVSSNYFRNREVFSIAIGGENQKTVWVAYNMFLAKSVDEGSSWEDCFSAKGTQRFCYCVVIHPHDDNTIYLGCGGPQRSDRGGAIYRTIDGGKHWKILPFTADHNIQSIAIRQDRPEEVWAVSGREYVDEGSIYKSADGGESWRQISTGLEESWFDEIMLTTDDPPVIFVGGGKGVYRSKDSGITWSQLTISGWPEDSWCRALAVDPSDSHKIYAQSLYGFSKSTDSGDHWETYDLVIDTVEFDLLTLVVDPQSPSVMYGGDVCLGIIKSENYGIDWSVINQGINANHIFHAAVDPHNPQVIAASTMVGVYVKPGDKQWGVLDYNPSYTLSFDPQNVLILFAGFDAWLGKFNLINGNATYMEFPKQTVNAIAIDPSNPDILYVGTEFYSLDRGGLYKSTDAGDNWEQVLVKSAPINVIKVDPHNHDIIYAGSGLFYAPVIMGNLYKSNDGGKNWFMTPLGDMVINTIAINPEHPEILYVGSGAPGVECATGVFKSVDRGTTWQWISEGLPLDSPIVDIELDPSHTQMLYAATFDKGIFISRDGGEYWSLLGMSDYWAYDVTSSLLKKDGAKMYAPSSVVNQFYTGTASGLYQYSGAGTGMITGVITDSSTGSGITGAQVVTDTGGVAYTVNGAYLLVTAAGDCTISVSAEGYSSSSCVITVDSGATVSIDLTLTPLSTPGIISGTVTDFTTAIPIEEATIVVGPGGYSAKSLAEGSYNLKDVIPNTYTVSVFKDGYSVARESGVVVSEGETMNVNFRLSSLGTSSIEGVITDALSGEVIEGAEIMVDPGTFFTTTDFEGSYTISDIRAGSYTLYISHEGYFPYLRGHIEVVKDESVTLDIKLQPCPFSVLGLSNEKLKKLRRFRDEILSQNKMGRRLVSLFYQHAPTISRCISSDPAFKARLVGLLNVLVPKVECLLDAGRIDISPKFIKKAKECFKSLDHKYQLSVDLHELVALLHDEGALRQFGVVLEKQSQKSQ